MGFTNFPNGITSMGMPILGNGIPATEGNVYFVDYGAGSDGVSAKSNAITRAWKTIDKAYDTVTTNKNDVICLVGNSTHVLTEMLDVSKNRVHFIGLDAGSRYYGQGAKVSLGVTTAATDIGAVKNTGVRNTFTNIKFMSSNTKDESLYCFVEGGEYTMFNGCEFYKDTDLDETGAAELVMNGDSPQLYNCTIGSSANAISGTIIRPNILMTKATAGTGKVARDVYMENCILWRRSSHVNNRFVYGANATDLERFMIMKNCLFANAKNASAVPAQNVAFGSSLTVGEVLLWDCVSLNAATAMSTTTGVFVQGYTPDATGEAAGIPIQAA